MATNEERKQVAARLRLLDCPPESRDMFLVLADLIEPEERVSTLTPGEICPECNKMVGIHESCCCKCGAKVVENLWE